MTVIHTHTHTFKRRQMDTNQFCDASRKQYSCSGSCSSSRGSSRWWYFRSSGRTPKQSSKGTKKYWLWKAFPTASTTTTTTTVLLSSSHQMLRDLANLHHPKTDKQGDGDFRILQVNLLRVMSCTGQSVTQVVHMTD